MSSDPEKYLRRVMSEYTFIRVGKLYRPTSNASQKNVEEGFVADQDSHPIIVKVETKIDWVAHLISFTAILISMVTLILLGATVYFTQKQWIEANRSAIAAEKSANEAHQSVTKAQVAIDQSRDQFIKDQRPYIAEVANSGERPELISVPGRPGMVAIAWTWYAQNYGKSPAIEVVPNQEFAIGKGPFAHAYDLSGRLRSNVADWSEADRTHMGAAEPPGGGLKNTLISNPMTQNEAQSILDSKAGFALRVQITYKDLSGMIYETSICKRTNAQYAIGNCPHDNYIH